MKPWHDEPDGGPAAPCKRMVPPPENPTPGNLYPIDYYDWAGMSLRDYFAAQTLPSGISGEYFGGELEAVAAAIAKRAYIVADAMIAERVK